MTNFLIGTVYSLSFLCVLFVLEFVTRKKHLSKELTRRIAHVLSGLFGVSMAYVLEPWVFITFTIFFTAIISVSYLVKFFSSIHGVMRKTYGELFLPLGILITFLISGGATLTYLVSVLILTISDPLAGLVNYKINPRKNSLLGLLVFFVSSSLIILIAFNGQITLSMLLIALLVTFIERFSPFGIDNLSIPVSSSLLLKLIL